jgi:hypothetical protein
MNHFDTSNLQQQQHQKTQPSSSISMLSDDKEMNHSYYERKRVNDDYINSLLTFIHDVEETKRYNQKKMASKVNDPWECLMTPKTTPSKFPIFQNPPSIVPHHPNDQKEKYEASPCSPPPLPPKLDQNRMPLTTHQIPRRNVFVSTFIKYYKKVQQQYHQRVPSSIYVTNDDVSSTLGYPSMRDFRPMHPDDIVDMSSDWRKQMKVKRATSVVPAGASDSTNSDATWVVSNQTRVFC